MSEITAAWERKRSGANANEGLAPAAAFLSLLMFSLGAGGPPAADRTQLKLPGSEQSQQARRSLTIVKMFAVLVS